MNWSCRAKMLLRQGRGRGVAPGTVMDVVCGPENGPLRARHECAGSGPGKTRPRRRYTGGVAPSWSGREAAH